MPFCLSCNRGIDDGKTVCDGCAASEPRSRTAKLREDQFTKVNPAWNDAPSYVPSILPVVGPYEKAKDCPWHPHRPIEERYREAGVCGECVRAGRTPTYSPDQSKTE